jgi:hypothetical protein
MAIQENTIRRFFLGEAPPEALAIEVNFSVASMGDFDSEVMIEDMEEDFKVAGIHIQMLCDAAIAHRIPAKTLNVVAFTLLASERFLLDTSDEVMMVVLYEWSALDIKSPLVPDTLMLHRRWIAGEPIPLAKRTTAERGRRGRLVQGRRKVRVVD